MLDDALTLPSYAKINWTLHVLGRRPDNYHELLTIFQTVTLHDRLRFTVRADQHIRIRCDAPDIPVDKTNLIYRAAILLRERYGIGKGATVDLEKHIPAGGGLGGGSSNAAIALIGLAHVWGIEATGSDLAGMGALLGADVPFFFTGGTAEGSGLGTRILPLADVGDLHLLIVTPDVKVLTVEAYKALSAPALTKQSGDIILSSSRTGAQIPDLIQYHLYNDFERVVLRLEPEIERVKNALMMAGARGALLAGSGSSVFGIFDNSEAQERAARRLRAEKGWRVFLCGALRRAEYQDALGPCAHLLERKPVG
ncbi:MAG: 4-(cytidine 5'-diphospho)-2-C-methyl-D-erythritol kinase [Acidobacteria bacterium]|nr:4-(cytidine 5'-diphospho)-2-C-methyl-D-erythritol kinase [Acidobacteriota bacterium]